VGFDMREAARVALPARTRVRADGSVNELRNVDRFVLSAGLVAAVVLRVWLTRTRLGQLDGDEAVVGLMALRFAHHGELRVFFWGQSYGGTLEPIVIGMFFRLFGTSTVVLKLVPVLFDALAAWLFYRIGRRITNVRVAAYAAVAFLCGPGGIVWLSTSTRGFYWATLVLGLAAVLCALRLLDDPDSTRDWIMFGLFAGLGFWQSPQILYFLLPAIVILVIRLGNRITSAWIAVPAAVVGAAPWLRVNLSGSWMTSLNTNALGDYRHTSYIHRLIVFMGEGLGVTLGVHVNGHWRGPSFMPTLVIVLVVGVLITVALQPGRNRALLLAIIVTYPFVFALFPLSYTVGEGRYVLYLWPFLALAFMYAARRRSFQIAMLAVVVILSVASLRTIENNLRRVPDQPLPWHNTALQARLHQLGVHDAYADYWIAYPLTFQTREHIDVVPILGSRFAGYDRQIHADPRPAWILLTGSRVAARFQKQLQARGISYTRDLVGPFAVYLPGTQVTPEQFDRRIFT
jgi:hypothetical protein